MKSLDRLELGRNAPAPTARVLTFFAPIITDMYVIGLPPNYLPGLLARFVNFS